MARRIAPGVPFDRRRRASAAFGGDVRAEAESVGLRRPVVSSQACLCVMTKRPGRLRRRGVAALWPVLNESGRWRDPGPCFPPVPCWLAFTIDEPIG